jgi:predicted nucleic acid-binding protein
MSDNEKAFIDTNVFAYLYSRTEPEKQKLAQESVDKYDCVVSTQVLNEFCNVCIRKLGKTVDEVQKALDEITDVCSVFIIKPEQAKYALYLHKKYRYNFFDCLMLSAAIQTGCKYIFSEDMQDGQIIENSLIIKNIFL